MTGLLIALLCVLVVSLMVLGVYLVQRRLERRPLWVHLPVRTETFRGTVRITKPIETLFHAAPCAAWRAKSDGRTPSIDLAAAGEFELMREGEVAVVHVVGNPIIRVEVPLSWPPAGIELDERQRELIRSRGGPSLETACIGEGAIVDGDAVEVTGPTSVVALGDPPERAVLIDAFAIRRIEPAAKV